MTKWIYPPARAISHARQNSIHGPTFGEGECLEQTEIAFLGVHGIGGATASLGWDLCRFKHPIGDMPLDEFLLTIPRAFPVWFKGGSPTEHHPEGAGHVGPSGVHTIMWSTDRLRTGRWDRVSIKSILTWNRTHPLRIVGWSEDFAGHKVPYKPHSKDAHH